MASSGQDKVIITAQWDPEAEVWVAESEDVVGLITEAATVEELVRKLRVLVPELLKANAALVKSGPVSLRWSLVLDEPTSLAVG